MRVVCILKTIEDNTKPIFLRTTFRGFLSQSKPSKLLQDKLIYEGTPLMSRCLWCSIVRVVKTILVPMYMLQHVLESHQTGTRLS